MPDSILSKLPKHWGPRPAGAGPDWKRISLLVAAATMTGGRGFRTPKKLPRQLDDAQRRQRQFRRQWPGAKNDPLIGCNAGLFGSAH